MDLPETNMTCQTVPPGADDADDMPGRRDPAPALDAAIQDAIGKALHAYCADIVAAPIPDKFLALLAQLEAKERQDHV